MSTSKVINACINYEVERLVFTSSMAVYGHGNPPFDESHTPTPIDPYGVANLDGGIDGQGKDDGGAKGKGKGGGGKAGDKVWTKEDSRSGRGYIFLLFFIYFCVHFFLSVSHNS